MDISSSNLTAQTVERLVEMISARGLKPGESFAREADLEKALGVSRPVLREAVSRLRALGLLDSRQCKGLIVARPDPVELFGQAFQSVVVDAIDLAELAELRYTLEIGSVDLAARRATAEQLTGLVALAEEFAQRFAATASDRSLDDIERDFHRTILDASHSSMLIRMHRIIAAYFQRCARERTDWDIQGSSEKAVWEHRAIAQALAERNVERARALLTGHLAGLLAAKQNG